MTKNFENERLNYKELEDKMASYKMASDITTEAILAHYEWLMKMAMSEKLISPVDTISKLKDCLDVSCMRHSHMSFYDLMNVDLDDYEQMLKERNGWN